MKIVAPITERKIKSLEKSAACGVVPGLWVKVVKLKSGELAKYFILRERSVARQFTLGKFPDLSLSEAFKKAAEWKERIAQGVDPAKEEKERRDALRREREGVCEALDILTFEKLIRQWIEFNEKRGRWSKTSKSKTETWDGFFRNHIPESLQVCPVVQLTPQMFYDALAEKWRTMIDTPERILSDSRQAIDWAMRSEMIPPMINTHASLKTVS